MQRRTRIDLSVRPETPSTSLTATNSEESKTKHNKEAARQDRKRTRWAARNKGRPASENPFILAIKPGHENYGEPDETDEELRARLENLEFGNYPGYFNYRTKSAAAAAVGGQSETSDQAERQAECEAAKEEGGSDKQSQPEGGPLEGGLADERLQLLREEWFRERDVLDIGCNRGHITYAIAQKFKPKFILGIDIDLKMIQMANRDIHLHLESGLLKQGAQLRLERAARLKSSGAAQYCEPDEHFPLASYVGLGPLAAQASAPGQASGGGAARSQVEAPNEIDDDDNKGQLGQKLVCAAQNERRRDDDDSGGDTDTPWRSLFPSNILFVEHNYVLSSDELVGRQKAFFDTIVCLSVTKWIHLNYRDSGLKRFFKRCYKHLKPGGLFVLEAQPFDNYGRQRKSSARLRANYYSIKFRPEEFDQYLLSEEIGFARLVYSAQSSHQCRGFRRPLKVFLK